MKTTTDKTIAVCEGKPVEKPLTIKTGERFTISTPEGMVSETGVRELSDYLAIQSLGALPVDFEPVWLTRRGTLPKRIAAHLAKTASVKLTSSQVSEIGNIARRNTSTAQTYHCDFTKNIDWSAGDFGDYGSCAWGDKAGMKDMVSENGWAVRFFRKESGTGYARAWVAPIEGNRLIVFNAYGETPIAVARILSVHFACGYRRISLTNRGSDCGVLWINGGSAYVLGAWGKIADVQSWSLDWEEIDADENHAECDECGTDLGHPDDNEYFAQNRYGDTVPCCEDCSFSCYNCDERYVEGMQRRIAGDRHSYCESCRDEIVRERAREREEEIERLEKKRDDLQVILDDLQHQIDDTQCDLAEVEDRLAELESEVE